MLSSLYCALSHASQNGRMSMLGLQTEIGQLKALAWSPSSAHKHLVAAGLSTGRTLLLNLAPSTLSLPVAPPPASPPVVATLPVKHARAVTSISFSPHDANYLATGLDRHRYDSSLLIWDIHDAVAASRLPPDDGDSHPYTRPELRLPTTAPLTKTSGPAEPRPIQVYCPSEQVHSVAFIPTAPYTLLSSAANKVIRLYDLRAPSSTSKEPNAAGSLAQWSTRTVMSLCPNPSSSLFASYESNQGNSTVRLWDTRYPGQEVVGWEVRGGIVGMSWVDSMRLGVGSKEGGVAVWDIVRCKPDQPGVNEWVTLGDMRQSMSFYLLFCMLIVNMSSHTHSRQAQTKHAFIRIHTANPAQARRCHVRPQGRHHLHRPHLHRPCTRFQFSRRRLYIRT